MASSDTELLEELYEFGQYHETDLTPDDLQVSVDRAKSHLKTVVGDALSTSADDWYSGAQEEALFWTALLFTKLQSGALDAKEISVGAIDEGSLLASADGEVTEWYRKYSTARDRLQHATSSPTRQVRSSRTSTGGSRNYSVDDA